MDQVVRTRSILESYPRPKGRSLFTVSCRHCPLGVLWLCFVCWSLHRPLTLSTENLVHFVMSLKGSLGPAQGSYYMRSYLNIRPSDRKARHRAYLQVKLQRPYSSACYPPNFTRLGPMRKVKKASDDRESYTDCCVHKYALQQNIPHCRRNIKALLSSSGGFPTPCCLYVST